MTTLHDRDITPEASPEPGTRPAPWQPPHHDLVRDLVGNGTSEAMARQIVESLHQLVHGARASSTLAGLLAAP